MYEKKNELKIEEKRGTDKRTKKGLTNGFLRLSVKDFLPWQEKGKTWGENQPLEIRGEKNVDDKFFL